MEFPRKTQEVSISKQTWRRISTVADQMKAILKGEANYLKTESDESLTVEISMINVNIYAQGLITIYLGTYSLFGSRIVKRKCKKGMSGGTTYI